LASGTKRAAQADGCRTDPRVVSTTSTGGDKMRPALSGLIVGRAAALATLQRGSAKEVISSQFEKAAGRH
jgi:hypothetical protein